MGEVAKEAKRYIIKYICDKCGKGEMISTSPPQWNHRCNECGHEQILDGDYPRIEFR